MLRALFAICFVAGCSAPVETSWCSGDQSQIPVAFAAGPGVWEQNGRFPGLREIWRAGGLRDGEQLAFPVGAVASSKARLAIADFRLAEVVVIEPDGTWLGPWGVRGEGPGEISLPVATMWDRRDETLAVFDFGRAKTVFFKDGDPVRDDVAVTPTPLAPILLSGSLPWAGVQPSGGVLIQLPLTRVAEDVHLLQTAVLRIAPGAESADTLAARQIPAVGGSSQYAAFAAPGWPQLVAAVGGTGEIVLGGLDARYRLMVLDEHGQLERLICRDALALALDDREFGSAASILSQAPLPDSLAPYGRIFVGALGRIWVQRARPSPVSQFDLYGVPGSAFDVFDSDGQYLGEVRAPPGARLQAAAGDTVWAFEIGDLDETWVVAYELTGLREAS